MGLNTNLIENFHLVLLCSVNVFDLSGMSFP